MFEVADSSWWCKRTFPSYKCSHLLAGQVCLHSSSSAYCISLQDAFHYCVVTSSCPVGLFICSGIPWGLVISRQLVYKQSYVQGLANILLSKQLSDWQELIPSTWAVSWSNSSIFWLVRPKNLGAEGPLTLWSLSQCVKPSQELKVAGLTICLPPRQQPVPF